MALELRENRAMATGKWGLFFTDQPPAPSPTSSPSSHHRKEPQYSRKQHENIETHHIHTSCYFYTTYGTILITPLIGLIGPHFVIIGIKPTGDNRRRRSGPLLLWNVVSWSKLRVFFGAFRVKKWKDRTGSAELQGGRAWEGERGEGISARQV